MLGIYAGFNVAFTRCIMPTQIIEKTLQILRTLWCKMEEVLSVRWVFALIKKLPKQQAMT